ncbi:MAG: hypothetical protein KGJ41_00930 [Rhodospirillales bacterium]|nr:hypothetical protein [Rhodospirillales bacterium]MDE2573988.1 hypothetical protein [Rhodospirillales bacterium]
MHAAAFAIRNLSVLAYAQGFTLWHYKSAADLAAASGDGFFNDATDMLAPGDMLLVSAPDGGRILVVAATANAVRTAPLA